MLIISYLSVNVIFYYPELFIKFADAFFKTPLKYNK